MKKFLSEFTVDPFTGHGNSEFTVSNGSNKVLTFTVEEHIDPIQELINYCQEEMDTYNDTLPPFLRDTMGVSKLSNLLKDARDAHRGNK